MTELNQSAVLYLQRGKKNDEGYRANTDRKTSSAWIADERYMSRHTKQAYNEFKELREHYFRINGNDAEKRELYKKMMDKRELFLELYDMDKSIITPIE
jgi:hypothetical protein